MTAHLVLNQPIRHAYRAWPAMIALAMLVSDAHAQMMGEPVEPDRTVHPAMERSPVGAGSTESNGGMTRESEGAMNGPIPADNHAAASESGDELFAALAGPAVRERVGRTIVRHDAKGEFRRVTGRPEEAVIALLGLDVDAREYCKAVFAERSIALGVLLADHLEEAFAYGDSIEKREREVTSEMITLFRRLWDEGAYGRSGPAWSDRLVGPPSPALIGRSHASRELAVLDELSAVLTAEQYAELERMLGEYWDAWIAWEVRTRKTVTEADCRKARERLERTLFSEDLRRAYDDLIKPYQAKLEKLFEAVEPTSEQRANIKTCVRTYVVESRLRPRVEQRIEFMGSLYRALDEPRRVRLFELVAAETAGGTW